MAGALLACSCGRHSARVSRRVEVEMGVEVAREGVEGLLDAAS